MKRNRFADEQLIGSLKEHKACTVHDQRRLRKTMRPSLVSNQWSCRGWREYRCAFLGADRHFLVAANIPKRAKSWQHI